MLCDLGPLPLSELWFSTFTNCVNSLAPTAYYYLLSKCYPTGLWWGWWGPLGTPKKGLEFHSAHHVTSDDFSASLCFSFFIGQKKVVVLEISAQTPLLQRGFPWAPRPVSVLVSHHETKCFFPSHSRGLILSYLFAYLVGICVTPACKLHKGRGHKCLVQHCVTSSWNAAPASCRHFILDI